MKFLPPTFNEIDFANIAGIVFDVDNTLYHRTREYLAAGTSGEMRLVGAILGLSEAETAGQVAEARKKLEKELSRPATMTEGVLSLGVTAEQWNALRCQAWDPESWLSPDEAIVRALIELGGRFTLVAATNSPLCIARRILQILKLESVFQPDRIFAPENLGIAKPDPVFFVKVAKGVRLLPQQLISIGDREFSDGPPALQAGYAGAVVAKSAEIPVLCRLLLSP